MKPIRRLTLAFPRHNIALAALVLALATFFVPSMAVGQGFSIGLNFTGATLSDGATLNGFTYAPPDTMGAVGPTQIAQLINGVYAVYDRTTGAQIGSKISDISFWNNAGLSPVSVTDPRILFDPSSNRWFAIQITSNQSTNNQILVARSNSSDLTAGWKGVAITLTNGKFADYPTLGLDATGVYVGTNDYTSDVGSFSTVAVYSMPKTDLLASTPSLTNLTRFANLSTRGFTIQPIVDFGPAKGHAPILAIDNTFSNRLNRANLTGTGSAGATLSSNTDITVSSASAPPEAKQPDGTTQIDTLDERFSANVMEVGNVLYAVRATTVSGRCAIRWTKLNEATNAVIQEGTISSASFDYFQPSIAANANGNVVIGFNRSGTGASDFISSFAVVGTTSGSTTTFGTPTLLKAGLSNYHLFGGSGERWGDFSAMRVDPIDPSIFWTFQEFPTASNQWATQVTQIKMAVAAATLTWKGTVSNVWDISSATNWNSSPATFFHDGDNVTFDETGANTNPVNITVPVSPGSVTVNNTATAYKFTGSTITGATGLVKQGTGTLTLANSNNYTGNTTINAGVVSIESNTALGSGVSVTQLGATSGSSTAALLINGTFTVDRNITVRSGSSGTATVGNSNSTGTATDSGGITLQKGVTLTAAGASTVTFSGSLDNSAGVTITKTGSGTVGLSGNATHGAGAKLSIQQGTVVTHLTPAANQLGNNLWADISSGGLLQLAPNSTRNAVLGKLTIAGDATPTGAVDVQNNSLILDYTGASPFSTIKSQVVSGFAGGAWNGNGIQSSVAATDPATYGLGYAENSDLGLISYSDPQGGSDAVDATTVIIKFTYVGDSNLDGDVDGDDYLNLLANIGSGDTWYQGDFDYDGDVDGDDYLQLLANTGASGLAESILAAGGLSAPVPEPSTLALAGLGLMSLLARCLKCRYSHGFSRA